MTVILLQRIYQQFKATRAKRILSCCVCVCSPTRVRLGLCQYFRGTLARTITFKIKCQWCERRESIFFSVITILFLFIFYYFMRRLLLLLLSSSAFHSIYLCIMTWFVQYLSIHKSFSGVESLLVNWKTKLKDGLKSNHKSETNRVYHHNDTTQFTILMNYAIIFYVCG